MYLKRANQTQSSVSENVGGFKKVRAIFYLFYLLDLHCMVVNDLIANYMCLLLILIRDAHVTECHAKRVDRTMTYYN